MAAKWVELAIQVIADQRRIARREYEAEQTLARQGHVKPTPERARHGELIYAHPITEDGNEHLATGARPRRVQPPVDRYRARGQITARQAQAADTLRDHWELGIVGRHDHDRATAAGGAAGFADAQLNAATCYRKATQALGPRLCAIVLPVVIGDEGGGEVSIDALAAFRRQNPKHTMGAFRVALDILADHYESP